MPYVPVPKDLTKVKTKVAFNLTKRQLIFFSIAGADFFQHCRGGWPAGVFSHPHGDWEYRFGAFDDRAYDALFLYGNV